jgi:hypothetical protein
MYAVIHKNRVIVGPIAWASGYFTDVLRIRHRITSSIPKEAPNELPFVIDENTIIKQAIENREEINPLTQQYYGPLWDISGEVAVASYEIHDLDLNSAQNNHKTLASQERYRKEVSGTTITVQGTEIAIDTSRYTRDIFSQKYLALDENQTINWKFGSVWIELSKQDLFGIVRDVDAHVQGCFDWEKSINDQIDACTTLQQLTELEIIEKQNIPEELL